MFSLICFALKEEAAPFQKIAAGKSEILILLTGIGHQTSPIQTCDAKVTFVTCWYERTGV
jgi:hypothetical protein